MGTILSAKNIYKTYKTSSGDVPALRGVSLEVEKGMFYAIIGKSGSGKSTLLHTLSGLDRPTKGEVFINGENLYQYSDEKMAVFRRRYMGFVFQQFNLLDEFNVLNNICMPLKLDQRKVDKQFLEEVTGLLRLEDKLKKYPCELSGGEQQRAAIARCLLARPQIIFADEPTGNLDSHTAEEIMTLMQQVVRKHNKTLVMVTHDDHLASYADRIFHIRDGKIFKIEETNQKREDEEYEHEGN